MSATHQALGRWPNAPLALVLAQVRFEPHAESPPALVAERIQAALPSAYFQAGMLQQVSFIVGQGTPPAMSIPTGSVGIELRNSTNTEALRLQADALTFNTAAYHDSKRMAAQWRAFMDALCAGRELRVMRLGLRYVDFIIPSAGHTPEDYFAGDLGRSPAPLGEQAAISFCLHDFPRPDGGHLRVQYSRGYGPPMLPPDLQDTVLPPPALTTRNSTDVAAVLDMDRWQPMNRLMTAEAIAATVFAMREDLAASFRAIMTDLARIEWQTPQETH